MNDDILKKIQEIELLTQEGKYERAKNDPYYFLTRCCYTLDEHNNENPYQLFPRKEYIKDLCDIFMTEDLIAIEKSRQMMVSWIFAGLALWFTMFRDGVRTFIMSKKEKDADALIDRIKVMYDRLPPYFKEKHKAQSFTYLKMEWPKQASIIQGVAQGADQVRSYTSSLIISDETAFQDDSEKVYEAVKPSLMGGGKFVSISTPNGQNWFYRLVKDKF